MNAAVVSFCPSCVEEQPAAFDKLQFARPLSLHQVTTTSKLIFSPGVFMTGIEMLILLQSLSPRWLAVLL